MSKMKKTKDWKEVQMSLSSILPNASELESYYRYTGSLTTPPCTEGVLWNVMRAFVNVSAHQVRLKNRQRGN